MTTWRRAGSLCPSLTSRERGIISAERLLGLALEIHEVGVQPLLRGGEMLQQDAALPVDANAFHDQAGQGYETGEIADAADEPTSDPGAAQRSERGGAASGAPPHAA